MPESTHYLNAPHVYTSLSCLLAIPIIVIYYVTNPQIQRRHLLSSAAVYSIHEHPENAKMLDKLLTPLILLRLILYKESIELHVRSCSEIYWHIGVSHVYGTSICTLAN